MSFYGGERLFEADAVNKRAKSSKNTFVFMKRFLGALKNNEEIFEVSKRNFEDYLISINKVNLKL